MSKRGGKDQQYYMGKCGRTATVEADNINLSFF